MIDKALLGAFAVASTSIYLLLIVVQKIQQAQKASKLGCQSLQPALVNDPSGVSTVRKFQAAASEKRMPAMLAEDFDKLSKEHGRVVSTAKMPGLFFNGNIMTIEPKNIQTVLAGSFKDFEIGHVRVDNFRPVLGEGIFASNGKIWEHSRALLRPQFVRSQISDITLEERHVQSLMTVIDRNVTPTGWTNSLDVQPLFFRLTLDSATEFLFGESVNSQLNTADTFAADFDLAQQLLSDAGRLGPAHWIKHDKNFHATAKRVHDYIDYFVQKAIKKAQDGKVDPERYVFLDALAQSTTDPIELRSQLLNILLAGRDTTASTLSWFIYTMSNPKHSATYKKLRAHVLEEFGTYTNPNDITFERLKRSQYLQWCISEILRVYPIVPINGRAAVRDTVLPSGGGSDGQSPLFIKKGVTVNYSVHAMHRRKDLWGPDADEFIPERWEARRPGWEYLPFNGGPRICIGQQFALTEIAYVLVRFIQRVDAIDGSQAGAVKHGLSLTNAPGEGVRVRLHLDQ